jgi:hypothetical protein
LRGYWAEAECDEAIRMLGARPGLDRLRDDPSAYLVVLCNLQGQLPLPTEQIDALLAPGRRPTKLLGRDPAGFLPGPAACLERLRELVAGMIASLQEKAGRVLEADASSRARALDRAMILQDEREARLFFRYHAESRSTFHRAYKELLVTLERDAAAGDGAPGVTSPHGPGPVAVGKTLAGSSPELPGEGSVPSPSTDAEESRGEASGAEGVQPSPHPGTPPPGREETMTPPPAVAPTSPNEPGTPGQKFANHYQDTDSVGGAGGGATAGPAAVATLAPVGGEAGTATTAVA